MMTFSVAVYVCSLTIGACTWQKMPPINCGSLNSCQSQMMNVVSGWLGAHSEFVIREPADGELHHSAIRGSVTIP